MSENHNTLGEFLFNWYRSMCCIHYISTYGLLIQWTNTITAYILLKKCLYQVRVITVFTVFRLLTDFVCLYNYEFYLSLCKIVRSSVILLLPLLLMKWKANIFFSLSLKSNVISLKNCSCCIKQQLLIHTLLHFVSFILS